MRRPKDRGGFTLVELLAAMALLSALGALLVQLVRGSFDLYREGDLRGDVYANAMPVIEMLGDDLTAINGGPEGRLLLRTDVFQGGQGDGFLLRIVRTIPGGEQNHPVLRRAGGVPMAADIYRGDDPGIGERRSLQPPSGLMEVAYALIQREEDPPGILSLYRGERAPAGAPGGFFDPELENSWDEGRVQRDLRLVATDILGLWLLCLAQGADSFDQESALESRDMGRGGTLVNWDSTRGILPRSLFPLALGPASLGDYRDDVFPRRVRIHLDVARGLRPDAVLRSRLTSEQVRIEVNTARSLSGDETEDRFIKVGNEWMEIAGEGVSGSSIRVARNRRRTRGVTIDHPAGSPVFAARSFRLTLALPAARSHYGEGG